MFAAVNEVICQLKLAQENGYRFSIDWSKSPYCDRSLASDPWNYFFQDPFDVVRTEGVGELPYLGHSTDTRLNFMRPRLYPNLDTGPMLLPTDRDLGHKLIAQYIRPKEPIRHIIANYRQAHFDSYIIGLHLRGPGRLHGGTRQLKKRYALKNGVPFQLYFTQVDRVLRSKPDAKIFVCSDSQMVIDECQQRYGDKILTYNSTRAAAGEMHQAYVDKYSGYKLGEDMIIEAYLLGATDYLIHGNSNVSNFVLCFNPKLEAKYVYAGDAHTTFALDALDRVLSVQWIRQVWKLPGRVNRRLRQFARFI
jgi:hypothetical protein